MIVELNIKNFAIIEEVNISFTPGLNIITGETGAGKSILIEALGIILGARSSKEFIQKGHNKAVLEAIFYIDQPEGIIPMLEEYLIEFDNDNLLIITKEICLNGPSLSRVNGRSVNLSMLNNITKRLVDIFGQHEHQSLLDMSNHQRLVDSFGDENLVNLKAKIKTNYDKMNLERKKLSELSMDSRERDREIDILKFQIQEIEDAKLVESDDEEIEKEYKKLSNIKEISSIIGEVTETISQDDFERKNILELIGRNSYLINNIKEFDHDLADLAKRLENIKFELEDLNREFLNYLDNIQVDYERINYLDERLNLVNRLKKKYGNSREEILKFQGKSSKRLEVLLNHEKEAKKINENILSLQKKLQRDSKYLSMKRKDISKKLEEKIKEQLLMLNMDKVDFKINFEKTLELTSRGYDKIEFLISTNPGEDLKPLAKIASGGEMSRIMLAFKTVLAGFDRIPTMIFDEIDTGISGRTAQIVGEKIYNISKNHQVICISHLPQIAALADSHYVINKIITENRTVTKVTRLSQSDRIKEMARLLGGVDLTETTLKHASEMIQMSKQIK